MATSDVLVLFKGKDVSLSKTAGSIGGSFDKVGGAVKAGAAIGATALAGLGVAVIGAGAKLIGLGSDAEEMLGKFDVVFSETGDFVKNELTNFADEVGRSKFELFGMASTFGDTLKPMGFAEEAAAGMAVELSQLATDLGSFNDMPMDESLQRLQGVLIGNHENALAFGVIINENTLKAELAAQGWDELTGAALEQAKVQARINLLMKGTTDAQGDAARTSGSWANQMRSLKATIADTATEMGLKLLPVFTPILEKIGVMAENAIPFLTETFDGLVFIISDVVGFFRGFVSALQEGQSPLDAIIDSILNWTSFGEQNWDMIIGIVDTLEGEWIPALQNAIAQVKAFIEPIAAWIAQNIQLSDVMTALGLILGGIVLSALGSILITIGGIMLPVLVLIGLVALLRTAWEENWGGIQEKTAAFMEVARPIFENLKLWLGENIPIAVQTLSDLWNDTFMPALEALSDLWSNTLMPALEKVWDFLTVKMKPIWEAIGTLWKVELALAATVLSGIWENVLLPAMKSVWEFVSTKLLPIFENLKNSVIEPLQDSFSGLGDKIQEVADFILSLAEGLENIVLPDWMTPGSPTPWEIGMVGIRTQMKGLTDNELPRMNVALQQLQQPSVSNERTINQSFTVNTSSLDLDRESRAGIAFATGGI